MVFDQELFEERGGRVQDRFRVQHVAVSRVSGWMQ